MVDDFRDVVAVIQIARRHHITVAITKHANGHFRFWIAPHLAQHVK